MCLRLKLTFEGDVDGEFVGLSEGVGVPWGEMLGDLLGLSGGEVEGDWNNI